MEMKQTALYRYCQAIIDEVEAWDVHDAVYTDQMRELHENVKRQLQMTIVESDQAVTVSYRLPKD